MLDVQPVAFADVLVGREPIIREGIEPETVTMFGITFALSGEVLWPTDDAVIHVPGSDAQRPSLGFDYDLAPAPAWYISSSTSITASTGTLTLATLQRAVGLLDADYRNLWRREFEMAYTAWDMGREIPYRDYTVRIHVRDDLESAVSPDTVETLLDLARDGQREDFMWLAGSAGVAPEKHVELWNGTRKRLGLPE
jgi:hypothetical protein